MSRSYKFTDSHEPRNLSRNAIPMRMPVGTSPLSATTDAEAWQDETDQGRDR